MADNRRLNVLMSRQRQALVVIGDKDCTKILSTDSNDISMYESRNRSVIKVFEWLKAKGRVVEIASSELSQEFVTFDSNDPNSDNLAVTAEKLGATDDSAATVGGWDALEKAVNPEGEVPGPVESVSAASKPSRQGRGSRQSGGNEEEATGSSGMPMLLGSHEVTRGDLSAGSAPEAREEEGMAEAKGGSVGTGVAEGTDGEEPKGDGPEELKAEEEGSSVESCCSPYPPPAAILERTG